MKMGLLGYALLVLLLSWAVSIVCLLGYMHRSTRVFSAPAVMLMSTACLLVAVLSTVIIVKYGPRVVQEVGPWLPEASGLAHYLARQGS